jgi:hypothetical protein
MTRTVISFALPEVDLPERVMASALISAGRPKRSGWFGRMKDEKVAS